MLLAQAAPGAATVLVDVLLWQRRKKMATTQAEGPGLVSERVAGGILPKVLNTFDMVAIFVAIVLFITNTTGFFGSGPVSMTYLIVGFITFLIPGAIVTGQ